MRSLATLIAVALVAGCAGDSTDPAPNAGMTIAYERAVAAVHARQAAAMAGLPKA